jgi:hypothetical protein
MNQHELRAPGPEWGRSAVRALTWVCALCGAVFLAGLFLDSHRTWSGFLIGFHMLLGLSLAGPVGLAFLSLSGARWSRPIESVPRAMAAALPAAAALGVLMLFGVGSLFEWAHESAVSGDVILEEKQAYLNFPFFALRLIAFFALWLLAGRAVVRVSASTWNDTTPAARRSRLRIAALFLLVLAPTWSLASVDWLQSLDPHWFSTIYALVTLSGLAVAGLAAAIILVAALDTRGQVTPAQYGDLGALLLSMALFWAYIWYCQYMLIWYTNLPEETPWYVARLGGAWGVLTKVSCVLCGALPFALLLFRRVRRSRVALVRVSAVVLAGQVVNLLVLCGPPLMGDTPLIGLWELAGIAGPTCLFFLLTIRSLQRAAAATTPIVTRVGEGAAASRPASVQGPAGTPA